MEQTLLLKELGINATVSLSKEITADAASTIDMGKITICQSCKCKKTIGAIDFESTTGGNDTRSITVSVAEGDAEGVAVDKNGNIVLSLDSENLYKR